MELTVDAATATGPLEHFWCSTGFTPASLLLDEDMRQQLAYLGSVPFGGVKYARIHFLLELVRGAGFYDERPDIDWSLLDAGLDALHAEGLKPFFELMGNPGGYFDNFEEDRQAQGWRRFIRELALHCIDRYGLDEVRSWYFETWNEPDHGWWKQSDRAFHIYYDACSNGLRDADAKLRFGGPGTATHMSERLLSLLRHLDGGSDYFTGDRPRVDFISVHEKGAESSLEEIDPDMRGVVEREVALVEHLRKNHPALADVPIMNNECDPQIGWSQTHSWRGRPYYAALIARTVNDHLRRMVDQLGVRYELLSNDNGFLGFWGQRTHLARYGGDGPRKYGRFEQIKKPAHNIMTMLALLGDQRLAVRGEPVLYADLGLLATRRGDEQVAILIYHGRDRIMSSGNQSIDLAIEGLPFDEAALMHYRIDEEHTNPYRLWTAGRRLWAQHVGHEHAELFAAMRNEQELALIDGPRPAQISGGRLTLNLDLPLPAVSLILLTKKPASPPGPVHGLRARRYNGLTGQTQLMLRWHDEGSRALHTYEVLRTEDPDVPPQRVNGPDILCTGYLHVGDDVRGIYRIRAVDQWGRSGEPSEPVHIE